MIIGVRWTISAAQPTTDGPRGVVLFSAAMMIMLGLVLVIWPTRDVGVRISSGGVTSNNLTTKPIFVPWEKVDRFEYRADDDHDRVYLVTTEDRWIPMATLGFWPYQRPLGEAYREVLARELARHRQPQR